MKRLLFKIPSKANPYAATRCLIVGTTTGVVVAAATAAFAVRSQNPNPLAPLSDGFRAGISGVIRSTRAVFTIASTVVDYKYSLHGLSRKSEEYSRLLSEIHLRSAERILKLCEANKGVYVKAGQFAAALRQIPKEYSLALSSLQDQAISCHFDIIKEVLISNLGQDFPEIFVSFDDQALAAASIAQVHHAQLRDNREVAVKVQYPGLEHQVQLDVAIMSLLSKSVAWFFPEYRFEWMVSEFAEAISSELDFIQEAQNSERTAKNFRNNNRVKIPYVVWELTTKQILTMEYCEGHKVNDVEFLKEMGINPKKVAKALMEVFAEMILVHGYIHGDPHPGNILVAPEGRNCFSLVLLDHGIYKQVDERFRLDYCQLWKALILLDSSKIQHLGESFGAGKYSIYFPLIFTGRTIDSGLLRSLISQLGASQQVRLLAYAKYAFQGLSCRLTPESGPAVKGFFSRLEANMSYVRLKLLLDVLEVLLCMDKFRRTIHVKLRSMLGLAGRFLQKFRLPFQSLNRS